MNQSKSENLAMTNETYNQSQKTLNESKNHSNEDNHSSEDTSMVTKNRIKSNQTQKNQSNKVIFAYSLCDSSFNKDQPTATKFKQKQGTVEDLAQYVQQGKAFNSAIFKNDYRKNENAKGFQIIVGDIDDTWNLEYIQQQDFVKENVALIYTSRSHQKEKITDSGERLKPCDRYRIVIALPEYIDDPELFPYLWNVVKEQIPPMDQSCKDISRQYFGFDKTQIVKCDESLVLDEKYIEEARKRKLNDELNEALKLDEKASKIQYDYNPEKTESLAKEALTYIPPRKPGTGNYFECFIVLSALTSEFGKSKAKELANQWSPAIKGDTWDPDYKIDTINRGGITIGSLFYIASQYGFNMPKTKNSKSTGKGFGTSTLPKNDVIALIDEVINNGLTGSKLTVKLKEVEQETGWKKYDLEKLYKQRLEEIEIEENKDELKDQLKELLKVGTQTVKLDEVFEDNLAKPLENAKEHLECPNDESLIISLLPIIASLIPVGNEIDLDYGFRLKPIFWACLVAKSSTKKSAVQDKLIDPIDHILEDELEEKYQKEYKKWKQDCIEAKNNDTPKPPEPEREFNVTTDSTMESLMKILDYQKQRGLLLRKDEFSGFFNSMNAYKIKGADLEAWQQLRNGRAATITRSSKDDNGKKHYRIPSPQVSVLGTTQPPTLIKDVNKLGGFDDPTGMLSRIVFSELKLNKIGQRKRGSFYVDVSDVLQGFYKKIQQLPTKIYPCSNEAIDYYNEWYNILSRYANDLSERDQGLSNVYSKMQGHTGNIALILHLANAALKDKTPSYYVELETMEKAVKLSSYFIDQYRKLRIDLDQSQKNDENALPPLLKTIVDLSEKKGWLTGRDVRNSTSKFKKIAMTEIRSYFVELEKLGYGLTEGEGNKIKYKNLDHNDHNDHKTSETSSGGISSCGQDNHNNDHKNKMTTTDDHNSDLTTEAKKIENCGQNKTVVKDVVKNNENDHKVKHSNDGSFKDSVGNVVNVVNSQPQQHDSDTTSNDNDDPQRKFLIKKFNNYTRKLENLPEEFVEEKLIDYTPESKLAKLDCNELKHRVEDQKIYYAQCKIQFVLNEYYKKFGEEHELHNEDFSEWTFKEISTKGKKIQSMIDNQ